MPSLGKTKNSNTGFSKKESVKHKQSVVHFTFLFHIHYHLRETSSCVIAFHSNLSLGNIHILFPSSDNIVQGRRGQVLKITCQIVHHFGGTGGMDRKSQFDALTSQQIIDHCIVGGTWETFFFFRVSTSQFCIREFLASH